MVSASMAGWKPYQCCYLKMLSVDAALLEC